MSGPPGARPVGIGLVGVGWMGELHTQAYRRVVDHYPECAGRARLVIAADASEERARAAAERLGYAAWTTDWREVVENPDVEAVSITTPNHLHREVALAAAQAGKHFWGEKPLGRFPHETEEIAHAVEEAGVRTIVGFNYRHAPAVQRARALLATGAIGEPSHFRSHFLADYSADPRGALSWRFVRAEAGLGVLADLGSHLVDLAHFLLGPIERVVAQQAILIAERPMPTGAASHFSLAEGGPPGTVENEDHVTGLVRFASGVQGVVEASRVAVGPHARYSVEVNGTDGALAWDFTHMNELQVYGPAMPAGDVGWTTVHARPGHGDFARFQPGVGIPMGFSDLKVVEAGLFLASVVDGHQREPGVREVLAAARVLDAMARSMESGCWEEVQVVATPGSRP